MMARALREQLDAEEGVVYQARVEDGRLILETREALLARLLTERIGPSSNGRWPARRLLPAVRHRQPLGRGCSYADTLRAAGAERDLDPE